MASTPPKRDSTEAACEDVIEGCKASPEDEKWLQAFQDEWHKRADGKDLSQRLVVCLKIRLMLGEFVRAAAEHRTGDFDHTTWKRPIARFCRMLERDFINELAGNPQAGAKVWLEFVRLQFPHFVGDSFLLNWFHAVQKALFERLRSAALRGSKNLALSGAVRDAAIGRVRQLIDAQIALYIEDVNAGIDDWHPPQEEWDVMLTVLSSLSSVTGGGGSELTALCAIGAPLESTAGFAVGIVLVGVGSVLSIVITVRGQLAALKAAKERQVEEGVRDALRALGRARADGLTPILDFLATAMLEAAVAAGVDVSGRTGTALSTFVWQQLFPDVPQERVAAAAHFKKIFDDWLRSAPR